VIEEIKRMVKTKRPVVKGNGLVLPFLLPMNCQEDHSPFNPERRDHFPNYSKHGNSREPHYS